MIATLPADVFLTERLAQLQPDLIVVDAESEARDALEHVVLAIRERHAVSRQHVSPATESGFVLCQERVQQPIGTTCPREALRSLGYDVVVLAEGAVA